MLSFLGGSGRDASSVKFFEIRLDESNIVFRGTESEAPGALLKGTLVLCLSSPLQIKGVRLRFTGERRVAWHQATAASITHIKQEEEFMRKIWEFKKSSELLPAGNYEWPFDMIIPGSTPESLEGMIDTWVIYRMKATIERGLLQQNPVARKQVRLIRSLEVTSLEFAHTMAIENIWPNKLAYCLSTPIKAVVFGSNICVDFKLIPLLKGLKIGEVSTSLIENQELSVHGPRIATRSQVITRTIYKDDYTMPEDTPAQDIDGQEGFVFRRSIPVPQSLKKCVQTVNVFGIRVRHHLAFCVALHNPDGHVSELHANLPVHIFLSPSLPIDENNNLVDQSRGGATTAQALSELTPPQYGEHQFDQLYSDIDTSGYMTPAGSMSGVNTPMLPRSRSISADNLDTLRTLHSNEVPISALQSRLNNLTLNTAGTGRPPRERSRLSSAEHGIEEPSTENENQRIETSSPGEPLTTQNSNPDSQAADENGYRRDSDEVQGDFSSTPRHVEYCTEDLTRVPSYTTAIRSNPRTPINEGLPSYHSLTRPSHASPPVRSYASAHT